MPKLPGINHLQAVKALEKAGFRIVRQGKHIVMSDGTRFLTIPRNNPVNAYTMAGIVRDAGLTIPGAPRPSEHRCKDVIQDDELPSLVGEHPGQSESSRQVKLFALSAREHVRRDGTLDLRRLEVQRQQRIFERDLAESSPSQLP